jgi:ABC-type polysaccharide/polyol phosphate export permease
MVVNSDAACSFAISQLVGVVFQVVFWATPIVYVESGLPEWLRRLERFNPLYVFSITHRRIVLEGRLPNPWAVLAILVITAAMLGIGIATYRRFRREILDEI